MPYTVTWLESAADDLAKIWLAARNRPAIQSASDTIDHVLKHIPEQAGLEFCGRRLLGVPPLAVVFDVHPDDRVVVVANVLHVK
jgi:plasmid stabilization system protein ParE